MDSPHRTLSQQSKDTRLTDSTQKPLLKLIDVKQIDLPIITVEAGCYIDVPPKDNDVLIRIDGQDVWRAPVRNAASHNLVKRNYLDGVLAGSQRAVLDVVYRNTLPGYDDPESYSRVYIYPVTGGAKVTLHLELGGDPGETLIQYPMRRTYTLFDDQNSAYQIVNERPYTVLAFFDSNMDYLNAGRIGVHSPSNDFGVTLFNHMNEINDFKYYLDMQINPSGFFDGILEFQTTTQLDVKRVFIAEHTIRGY